MMVNKDKALIELLKGEDYRSLNQSLYNLIKDRIEPVPLKSNIKYPAISYIDISGNKDPLVPISRPRIQFNCYVENIDGDGYLKSGKLYDTLNNILMRFKGIVSGIKIKQVIYISDFPLSLDDVQLYRWTADYYIVFENE